MFSLNNFSFQSQTNKQTNCTGPCSLSTTSPFILTNKQTNCTGPCSLLTTSHFRHKQTNKQTVPGHVLSQQLLLSVTNKQTNKLYRAMFSLNNLSFHTNKQT